MYRRSSTAETNQIFGSTLNPLRLADNKKSDR